MISCPRLHCRHNSRPYPFYGRRAHTAGAEEAEVPDVVVLVQAWLVPFSQLLSEDHRYVVMGQHCSA